MQTIYTDFIAVEGVDSVAVIQSGGEEAGCDKGSLIIHLTLVVCFFKVALLITDGKQSRVTVPGERGPVLVSGDMKARGIEIHAFGIGQADVLELLSYASHPDFVLKVEDFTQLDENVLDQAVNLCPCKLSYRQIAN